MGLMKEAGKESWPVAQLMLRFLMRVKTSRKQVCENLKVPLD